MELSIRDFIENESEFGLCDNVGVVKITLKIHLEKETRSQRGRRRLLRPGRT